MRRRALPLPARRVAVLLLLAGVASATAATGTGTGDGWHAGVELVQRRLVERADSGSRLLDERGPMARLRLVRTLALPGGAALQASAAGALGELDYDGRTQAGVPLATNTDHGELELAVRWRPLVAGAWGEGWLVLQALQQRRRIASTAVVAGLDESSTLLSPGVRWQAPAVAAAGWSWQPALELRASGWHRLRIDYGGAFDTSSLKGGRRRELALELAVTAPDSPWSLAVHWSHARQGASPGQPLRRDGAVAGSVRQPALRIDDVGLRAVRAF